MLPVAAIAAHTAQQHIRRRRVAASQQQQRTLRGLGYDITADPAVSPALRIFARYWWAVPITGLALYTSFKLRKKEGGGRQVGEMVLDTVNILAAVSGIIALLELEASKTAPIPVVNAAAAAATIHGFDQNFPDYPTAERRLHLQESVVPFLEE
jgi:hypothetical protein